MQKTEPFVSSSNTKFPATSSPQVSQSDFPSQSQAKSNSEELSGLQPSNGNFLKKAEDKTKPGISLKSAPVINGLQVEENTENGMTSNQNFVANKPVSHDDTPSQSEVSENTAAYQSVFPPPILPPPGQITTPYTYTHQPSSFSSQNDFSNQIFPPNQNFPIAPVLPSPYIATNPIPLAPISPPVFLPGEVTMK